MTYRLIGLMSFVLLLCMATFATLTRLYENEIMAELAKTVTAVGQQTFRSLENGSMLVAGKGHESTQTIGSEVIDFDDRDVVRDELRRLGGRAS